MPRMVVLEITEHERVSDMNELADVVKELHADGFSFALDDFGDGRSKLEALSQIKARCCQDRQILQQEHQQ